ncbi:hypothetical protein DQM00_21170 [Shigella sonnei]|nr:hypothetical protein [Shigella sonnei]
MNAPKKVCAPTFAWLCSTSKRGSPATAEISRTSIWQWIHHQKTLSNGKPVTKALFR